MKDARAWLIILGLSLGPAAANGFARFAYGLILPEMRADLGWSFTEAGWINTANAIGYLAGSIIALAAISRLGPRALFIGGMWLLAVALLLCGLTRDVVALSAWRILAGIGGAPVFIAGGVIASAMFGGDRRKGAAALAVYFGGGGLGMIATGGPLPFFMDAFGAAVWPLAWILLGLGAAICFPLSVLAAMRAPDPRGGGAAAGGRLPVVAMSPALAAYFCFGLGYTGYITFLVAWMRDGGAGAPLVAGAWSLMGAAVFAAAPFWSPILARAEGGRAIAITLIATGTGAAIPLFLPTTPGILASALIFGASFFMVPTSVTAFGKRNLPEARWGASLALMTVVFSVGQIFGPVLAGAVSDLNGDAIAGLMVGAGILLIGAAFGAAQRPLTQTAR
ncbi:MAG: YbfB/YjiJ family MFS transporter [Pseudomonadota bacterium]